MKKRVVKTIIEIEHLEAGQPRAYADSRYRAKIRATRHGIYTNDKVIEQAITEEEVKVLTQFFVRSFKEKEEAEWHEARLEHLKKLEVKPSPFSKEEELVFEWEVLVVQPFLD